MFLDENGEPLASAQPLKLHVSWYEPGKLVVTDASWTGGEAVTVALFLDKLPEEVSTNNIWGETSPDGRTWTAFATEEFEVKGDEEKAIAPSSTYMTTTSRAISASQPRTGTRP